MECAICFVECKLFKVLKCGHYFCPQCVEAMRQAPSTPDRGRRSPDKSSHSQTNGRYIENGSCGVENSEPQSAQPTTNGCSENEITSRNENGGKAIGGIPCPKCRRSTPMDYNIKNKYVCKLVCRTCDEEKLAEEFRWCNDCQLTICSRCFVDKHVEIDPSTSTIFMHNGSKWNDKNENYPQAIHCARRVLLELKQADETVKNSQKYVAKYLEDLKEYLNVEIEQKIKSTMEPKEELLKNLCKSYNINLATDISPLESVKSGDYRTLLDELIRIADMTDTNCDLLDESFKFKCLPYKQMSDLLIQSDKKEGNRNSDKTNEEKHEKSSKLDLKLSRIIDHPQMTKPNDFCYLDDFNTILIIDYEAGIFSVDTKTMACRPTNIKLKGQQFCRIRSIPDKLFGMKNIVAFNNQLADKEWRITFLDVEKTTKSDDLDFGGKLHQMLTFPDRQKVNPTTACSENDFYCATTKHIYHMKNTKEWGDPVYACSSADAISLMCSVVPKNDQAATVQIFVSNRVWKSIDVLLYNENSRTILANYRVPVLNNENSIDDYFLTPSRSHSVDQSSIIEKQFILMANKKDSKILLWSGLQGGCAEQDSDREKDEKVCAGDFELLFDFRTKFPQKIMRCPKFLLFISQSICKPYLRQVEICRVYHG